MPKAKRVVKKKLPELRKRVMKRFRPEHHELMDSFLEHTASSKEEWNEALRFLRGLSPEGSEHVYSVKLFKESEPTAWGSAPAIKISHYGAEPEVEVFYRKFNFRFPLKGFEGMHSKIVERAHKNVGVKGGLYFPVMAKGGKIEKRLEKRNIPIEYNTIERWPFAKKKPILEGELEAKITLPDGMFDSIVQPLHDLWFNSAADLRVSIELNTKSQAYEKKVNKTKLEAVEMEGMGVHHAIYSALKTIYNTDGLALLGKKALKGRRRETVRDMIHYTMPKDFSEARSWDLLMRMSRVIQARAGPGSMERRKAMEQLLEFTRTDPAIKSIASVKGELDPNVDKWLDIIGKNIGDRDSMLSGDERRTRIRMHLRDVDPRDHPARNGDIVEYYSDMTGEGKKFTRNDLKTLSNEYPECKWRIKRIRELARKPRLRR